MTLKRVSINTPLSDQDVKNLKAGDCVSISGVLYTARDAAHARLFKAIQENKELPFDPQGQVIFYVGPTPAKPGHPIGSTGPTTASRMDPFTPALIERGIKGMIGKGRRSKEVIDAIHQYKSVYFGAVEGTAALLSKTIISAEVIAYKDLGAEAVYCLVVEDFPAVVINDIYGGDLYEIGKAKYASR